MRHELKTWQTYWNLVNAGAKTFELRFDDRDFQVGDILVLKEYLQFSGVYTGRVCERIVTSKMNGPKPGLSKGYCILSIKEVPDETN
jgi:hypothetical protein